MGANFNIQHINHFCLDLYNIHTFELVILLFSNFLSIQVRLPLFSTTALTLNVIIFVQSSIKTAENQDRP